ncbi:MAG: hypothetical protein E6Q36_07500 [Chryseobacterium sp.]|nr:MAG: hypothetical protein E6Q36_07500 [Chryseobacterium sp.]
MFAIPPRSPYSLIQEDLFNQPFWLLVTCILLNRSSRSVAERVLSDMIMRWPDSRALSRSDRAELAACVRSLGFMKRRTEFIINLANADVLGYDLITQKGIGEYAARSYKIFCCNELGESEPTDGPLKQYWQWRVGHDRGTRDCNV